MSRNIRLGMADQLGPLPFSTRLRNALIRLNDYPHEVELNFDDVIESIRRDRDAFSATFLRLPGAGRKSLNELLAFVDDIPDDGIYHGRTVAVTFTEADDFQRAISEACNHMAAESRVYRNLRKLQALLDAGTIHIEQSNDQRSFFRE